MIIKLVMLLSLLYFILITLLCYFSIIGIGQKIFSLNNNDLWVNNFVSFAIGLVILNIFGHLLYYLNFKSNLINLSILLIGLYFFDFKKNQKLILKYFLINLILFSGLLVSKLHEDWSYHFSFIEQVARHEPIIGIGNLEDIHILSSSYFTYLQKLFYLPYFEFKTIMIPTYLIYFNLVSFLIYIFLNSKKKIYIIYLSFLVVIVAKFSRLSEFGYDYLSNFFLIKIIILYFLSKIDKIKFNYLLYFLLFIYAFSIKITALFFLPIFLIITYEAYKERVIEKSKINYLLIFFIFLLLGESVLRSGCLIYFAEFTCLSANSISWTMDFSKVDSHSEHVNLWAKGFYHQNDILDKTKYAESFNWFPNWLKIHFLNKMLLFILIFTFFTIIALILEKFKAKKNINFKYFFISSFISTVLWFYFLPQFRFGTSVLISLFIGMILIFLNEDENLRVNKKISVALISIIILIFNTKNIMRIQDEMKRSDNHKFVNFPFPPAKRLANTNLNNGKIKFQIDKNRKIKIVKWFKIIN